MLSDARMFGFPGMWLKVSTRQLILYKPKRGTRYSSNVYQCRFGRFSRVLTGTHLFLPVLIYSDFDWKTRPEAILIGTHLFESQAVAAMCRLTGNFSSADV